MNNRGFTLVELILVVILTAILMLLVVPLLSTGQPQRRASCANNLKQMGLIFKMYSNESPGDMFPPMLLREAYGGETAAEGRGWSVLPAPQWSAVIPEYLSDPGVLFCPNDLNSRKTRCLGPDAYEWFPEGTNLQNVSPYRPNFARMDIGSYAYTGWLVDDADVLASSTLAVELRLGMDGGGAAIAPQDARGVIVADLELSGLDSARVRSWIETRTSKRSEGRRFPGRDKIWDGFQLRGNDGGHVIQRLQDGIEQTVAKGSDPVSLKKAIASIPVLWDLTYYEFANPNPDADVRTTHAPPGSLNCLYMDGHVEFVKLSSRDHLLCSERVLALGAPEGS